MKPERDWINPLSDWSTNSEEVANTITHGLGLLLSLVGAVAMGVYVLPTGDVWRLLGGMIYTVSLVAVYAASTLAHACTVPNRKHRFRMYDQGLIYLLIVATYTPFSMVFLRTAFWWSFLIVLWAIAIVGFLSKVALAHRIDRVSIPLYVALGWLPVVALYPLVGQIPPAALWWTLIGGVCYTVGTLFEYFDSRCRYFHAVWHVFVIAGSTCHFFVILFFVVAPD